MKKIFIIAEDSRELMNFYLELLKKLNVDDSIINYFYNGEDAIEFIKNNSITNGFLITDYNMPKKSGGDVLKESLKNDFLYRVLRSSQSIEFLANTLRENYEIKKGIIIINKNDPVEILIDEIKEYLSL